MNNIIKGDFSMVKNIMRYPLILFFILLISSIFAASNVNVSPDTMNADTGAWLTVTADVASGSDIEIFLVVDYNGDGVKNGPDFIIQYYKLKEGVAPIIPSSPKPGDEDGANSHLQTTIGLWGAPMIAGKFIVNVKDSGAQAGDTLTINQPSTGQSVSGTLVNESDTPIPGIIIAQDVNENEWMILSNLDGTYTINLPTGICYVGGIAFGLITDFEAESMQAVSLDSEETITNVTLKVYNGVHTVSGRVSRTSGPGVPYLMIWAETEGGSQDMASNVISDADGNFQIPVKTGLWEIGLDDTALNQRGLSGLSWKEIDISGNVTDFNFVLDDADTYISGRVTKKSDSTGIIGCNVLAYNNDDWEVSCFTRGPDGSYVLLVKGGNWTVEVDEDFIFQNEYILPQSQPVSPSSGSPATNVNFELEKSSSFIEAEVKESGAGTPVAGMGIWVNDDNWNFMGSKSTDTQGKAKFPVMPGSYKVGLSSEDVFGRNYIMPQNQDVSVATSETVKVVFSLVSATASIEGTVTHDASPINNVTINLLDNSFMWIGNLGTSETGYYKFPVNPGTYYIQPDGRELIEKGIAPVPIQQVSVTGGVNTRNFNLTSPNCTINIYVQGESVPLEDIGTFVQPITEPWYPLATIFTNASGLSAYPITNGTYDIGTFFDHVQAAGFIPQSDQRVTVSNGQTLDIYYNLHADNSSSAIDAILNIFDIDDTERNHLDKNKDGRLDVADLIFMMLD